MTSIQFASCKVMTPSWGMDVLYLELPKEKSAEVGGRYNDTWLCGEPAHIKMSVPRNEGPRIAATLGFSTISFFEESKGGGWRTINV